MDKPQKLTPIVRNRQTKKRLTAYELHIQTHELPDHLSQAIREVSRSSTPEPSLTTASLPTTPPTSSMRLVRVEVEGKSYYVREDELISPKHTDPEPPTPRASIAQSTLLELAAITDNKPSSKP